MAPYPLVAYGGKNRMTLFGMAVGAAQVKSDF
jgi:hypothetical protein